MIDHSSSHPDGNTSTKCLKSAPFPSLIRLTPPVLILLPLLLLLLSTPSFARRCLPMTSLTPAAASASASASLSVVPEGVWIDGRARAKLREGGNNGCVRSRSANYNQLFAVRTYSEVCLSGNGILTELSILGFNELERARVRRRLITKA